MSESSPEDPKERTVLVSESAAGDRGVIDDAAIEEQALELEQMLIVALIANEKFFFFAFAKSIF